MHTKFYLILFNIGFLILVQGCAKGDGFVLISGNVSLDGIPLESGNLTFSSADGMTALVGCSVNNGQFSLRIPPGKKHVSVFSVKITKEIPRDAVDGGGSLAVTEPILKVPGMIHGELTDSYELEVTKSGEVFNIDLQSKELLRRK